MNSTMPIKQATLQDITALNILVNSAYRGEPSRQGWTTEADLLDGTRIDEAAIQELINKPATTILKYEEGGNILGCVELRKEDNNLYLGMLSVKPDTQGKGIGKALLKAAETFALEQKCTAIFMTVISVRRELINWYLRHGYHLTGECKPFVVPDTRWGIPKKDLEFVVLEKKLLVFREATLYDIPQIQIVRNSVKENTLSDPMLVSDRDCEEFITVRGKGWVCEIGKEIVGFAIADLKENNIWALFLTPCFERKGIGQRLHTIMLDWYFSQTQKTAWLGTAPNTRAEAFYRKAGWEEAGMHGSKEIKFEMTADKWQEKRKGIA